MSLSIAFSEIATVNASGFFDPSAKRQIADLIGDELMARLRLSRQLGN